jgi:hypothetical protein
LGRERHSNVDRIGPGADEGAVFEMQCVDGATFSAIPGIVVEEARGCGPTSGTWDMGELAEIDALKDTEDEEENWKNE